MESFGSWTTETKKLANWVLTSPTTIIRGFITDSSGSVVEPDAPFSLNISFTASPDQVKGTGTALLRDGSTPEAELEFLIMQQHSSGLIATTEDGPSSNLYENALAAIVFIHSGGEDLTKAEEIFNALEGLQISDGVNQGGFRDAFNLDGPLEDVSAPILTFGNAWTLMALNYYTLSTGNTNYMDMTNGLADFLANRQIQDSNESNFGGLFSEKEIPSGDPSGSDATPGAEELFITQDHGAAYSAFDVFAEMPWLSTAAEREFYREKARQIKEFLMNRLQVDGLDAFAISTDSENIPSVEAQTATFLSLIEEMDLSSGIDLILDPANNFLASQIFQERQISGTKFRRDPFSCPPDPTEHDQFIWFEGSSRAALALKLLSNSQDATAEDVEGFELLSTNLQKVQDPSGGYPTHLDVQLDGCPPVEVGDSSIGSVTAAWRYFSEVSPPLNPYLAAGEAAKTVTVKPAEMLLRVARMEFLPLK